MFVLKGHVVEGSRDFCWRMTEFPSAFRNATGEYLYPGTLNVKIDREISLKEQFRIRGKEIGDPAHDVLFEVCRINRLWAYRAKLIDLSSGEAAYGDDIFEIICAQKIPNALAGHTVNIEVLRDDISNSRKFPADVKEPVRDEIIVLPILRRVTPPSAGLRYRRRRAAQVRSR